MVEVKKGVLVIGFSNTVLFCGEQTIELLLLDLGTGKDFALPLSEEQAEFLLHNVTLEDMLDLDVENLQKQAEQQEEPTAQEDPTEPVGSGVTVKPSSGESREKLEKLLNDRRVVEGVQDAWSSSEEAQQL